MTSPKHSGIAPSDQEETPATGAVALVAIPSRLFRDNPPLTDRQWRVFGAVAAHNYPSSQDIAAFLGISLGSATRAIHDLCNAGVIENLTRYPAPPKWFVPLNAGAYVDRRTEKGRDIWASAGGQ